MKNTPLLLALLATLMPAVHAQRSYGAGTPGAAGFVPTLTSGPLWMGSTSFSADIGFGLGGATAWLGASLAPGSLAFAGTTILIDLSPANNFLLVPIALSGPAGAAGVGQATFTYPLNIPPTPALAGFRVYAQIVVDEGNGYAASRGLDIELRMPQMVFVGTSVGGSQDPLYLVDPTTSPPTIATQFNGPGGLPGGVDNITGAEFAHGGRRAYFGQRFGDAVQEVNFDVSPPTLSTLYSAIGPTFGIGVDHQNGRVYTIEMDIPTVTREFIAIDCTLGSPTYGQRLATTSGLSVNTLVYAWEISPDGLRAAILNASSRELLVVDTDPTSAGYMTWQSVGQVPAQPGSFFAFVTNCDFTPNGLQVLVTMQTGNTPDQIARYDLLLGAWIDHNPIQPGTQNIGGQSLPPVSLPAAPFDVDVAPDGTFAVVSGWDNGGGLGRLDLDTSNLFFWSYTPIPLPGPPIDGGYNCGVSPDSRFVATYSAPQLLIFDARTTSLVGQVPLPNAGYVSIVTWH